LLTSLQAQDLGDFEVVVTDNRSADDTPSIVEGFARTDRRFRYYLNERNLGQVANFNRAFERCRGRYVRWIGADDWLEPSYARRCVEALERVPQAIGATTYQDHVDPDGTRHYAEYTGERLDSPRPDTRYRRMLWFFTADYRYADPIYSLFRRSMLSRTRGFAMVPAMDHVLASELALLGPFVHVTERLAHRGREPVSERERLRRYVEDPSRAAALDPFANAGATLAAMWEVLERAELTSIERARCRAALARYTARCWSANLTFRTRAQLRALRRAALSSLAGGALSASSSADPSSADPGALEAGVARGGGGSAV
jgi:glycosyltransferase involved in cell wall biosynthesis